MELPVRHGEGKFVVESPRVLEELQSRRLIALRYAARPGTGPGGQVAYPDDPNGSIDHIAGICDPTGRVFGLMPHPEAFLFPENHPEWSAGGITEGAGLAVFRNGVRAARAP